MKRKKKRRAVKKTVRTEVKRTRTVTRTTGNPVSRDRAVREAVERFTGFRGYAPAKVSRVRLPDPPKVLLTIGECIGIMYRTNRDGQVDNYLHRFAKSSRPALCCSRDGKTLYLLGGAYRVTDRGIEDA